MRGFYLRRFVVVAVMTAGVALAGVFASWPEVSAASGTLSVSSGSVGVGQGATLTLSALDVGEPGVGAWTVDVSYDPAVASIADCQAKQGGICNPDFAEDALRVAGTSLAGLRGDHALAQIAFTCVVPGVSLVSISVDVFSDATLGDPQPIDATLQSGTLTCTEEESPTVEPTPEPTAAPPGSEPEKLAGDADCDGDVDAVDAAYVLQLEAGLIEGVGCPGNADANHDGSVGPVDAALILQTSAGLLG